jgi:hypothetical protein
MLATKTLSEEMTLGDWIAKEWWPRYIANLPLKTPRDYAWQINMLIARELANGADGPADPTAHRGVPRQARPR